jgi:hypothetical protein
VEPLTHKTPLCFRIPDDSGGARKHVFVDAKSNGRFIVGRRYQQALRWRGVLGHQPAAVFRAAQDPVP